MMIMTTIMMAMIAMILGPGASQKGYLAGRRSITNTLTGPAVEREERQAFATKVGGSGPTGAN